MAESVDASVSNTDGAIRAGSTPAQGTESGSRAICSLFLCANVSQLIGLLIDKVKHFVVRIGSMFVHVDYYY